MPVRREDMELESGLADDFDATITSASFGFDERYAAKISGGGEPDPMLTLVLEGPTLEQSVTQRYATGAAKQWQISQDGREVVSGKDPNSRRFNENSRAGQLVKRLITLAGGGDVAKGQEFFVKKDFYMTQGGFYEGLTCHWKRETLPVVGGGNSNVLLPTAILSSAAPAAGGASGASGINPDWIEAVVKLAEGKTEKELRLAFIKDASVKDNQELKHAVFNKGLIGELVKQGFLTAGPDGKF